MARQWRFQGSMRELWSSIRSPSIRDARTTDAVRDLWTQIENEQRSESGEVKHSVQYAAVTQSLMEVLSGGNVANVDMLRKILQCQKRTIMCVLGILGAARVVRWEGPHVSLRSEDEASGEVWNLKKRMRSCDEACRELKDPVAGLEADISRIHMDNERLREELADKDGRDSVIFEALTDRGLHDEIAARRQAEIELSRLMVDLAAARERIETREGQLEDIAAERDDARTEARGLQQTIEELRPLCRELERHRQVGSSLEEAYPRLWSLVETAQRNSQRPPQGRRWGDRSIRDMISALTTVPEAVWDQVMPPLGFPTYRCVKRIRAATMAKAGLTPELLDGSPDHVREMLDRSGIVWEWVRGSPVA